MIESHSRHNSSWGVGVVAGARVSALPVVPATASSSAAAVVSVAAVAHARSTPMHDAYNSCSDTAMNSLRVQRCRKVRQSRTVGSRYAEQTVDMSPAPAAGTYRRSAGTVHAQRQVPWECLAESSRGGPGPGPGPGGRSGWGSLGPRCGLSGDSLLIGDATWASSICTAISGLGAGMWYREFGSMGAKW